MKSSILTPALITAASLIVLEQILQWRYGPMAAGGMALLVIGLKAKHSGCACAGALVLTLLMI